MANFRRYFVGQLLSTLGTWMQITAQVWLVLELRRSGSLLGVVSALQFLPFLFVGPLAGVAADTFDNRYLLALTNGLAGFLALGLGLLASSGSLTIGWLCVGAASIGVANAFDRAAGPAFVSALVDEERLPSAIGLYSVTTSASRMVGTAAAGVLIATVGAASCLYINAASYLIVLAMSFLILVPSVVKLGFHAGSDAFGLAEVFSGAGSTVAGFLVGALGGVSIRKVAFGALALGGATALTGASPVLPVFCVLMFVVGLAATGYMTLAMTVIQSGSYPEMRGRVNAMFGIASSGTMPIGALLAGVLIDALGPRGAMMCSGASAIVAGTLLLLVDLRRPAAMPGLAELGTAEIAA